jgi:hypothetical protein
MLVHYLVRLVDQQVSLLIYHLMLIHHIKIIQHNHQLYKWIINVKNKQNKKYKEILFENPFCFYIA